jgi:LPXTG-motif cell wall-anchored protein
MSLVRPMLGVLTLGAVVLGTSGVPSSDVHGAASPASAAAGAVALPYTGAQGIESTAWAALLTLAAGGILVARRRRAQH